MKMITATWDHAVNSKDKLQSAFTSEWISSIKLVYIVDIMS